jgi:glycosyltransferase involved in cell wall biosynthesis
MGAATPRVTVVIPTYNRWLLLRSALWSALRQEGVDLAVVVVDDGSTDGTYEHLQAVDDSRLTVVRLPRNEGVSSARNAGLARTTSEWVAFLDDDDAWAPSHLAGLLGAAANGAGESADIVYSGCLTVTRERQVRWVRRAPTPEGVPERLFSTNALVVPSRVLVRTDAVRSVGGFDTAFSLAADWDLWLRMVPRSGLAMAPALSVAYTLHGGNMSLDMPHAIEELKRLEERHAGMLGSRRASFVDRSSRWIARSYRVTGDRRHAATWYLRSFRWKREPRDLARAAGMLLGERAMDRVRDPNPHPAPPEAEGWLEELRGVDRLAPDELPFG